MIPLPSGEPLVSGDLGLAGQSFDLEAWRPPHPGTFECQNALLATLGIGEVINERAANGFSEAVHAIFR